jgi:transcriptional regulator with XRE-family HTH domain
MYGFVRICPERALDPSETTELSDAQSRELADRIREELARRRISRQQLATDAKISISTLEKALNGSRPFTLATIVRLEEALHLKLRAGAPAVPGTASASAPVELGGYGRDSVKWLEGDYLTLRPSFEAQDAVFAYRTQIGWDDAAGHLGFQEFERMDAPFSQKGAISIPNKSGQIYLHTNDEGQFRLAILGRPLIGGEMYGILTTLRAGQGGALQPASAALALLPLAMLPAKFGRILSGDALYSRYRGHLTKAVGDGYIRMMLP